MRVRVRLIASDLRLGQQMCSYGCPVWRAVTRKLTKKFPGIDWRTTGLPVVVTRDAIVFGERFGKLPYEDRHIKLSRKQQYWIADFDMHRVGELFSFIVELPHPLVLAIRRNIRAALRDGNAGRLEDSEALGQSCSPCVVCDDPAPD